MRAVVAASLTFGLAQAALAQGKLNLYCTANEEWCKAMSDEFARRTGVDVAYTRKGTGETYAQIKAEKENPKGDIWWGGTGDPHLQAAEERLTTRYEATGLKELLPWAKAQWDRSQGRVVGIYMGAIGFVYNRELLARKGIAPPACWSDLLKPEFKGEIQMSNPYSSGTAYTVIATLVQLMGEDKAFAYLKQLHGSVNQYTKQGPAPGQAAARGETMIAITFLHDGAMNKKRGFPVEGVAPCEGTGYEIGSMSIIDGARNMVNAKKFYEFALSVEGQKMAEKGESFQAPSNAGTPPSPYSPDLSKIKLIDYDFAKYGSGAERRRLLAKWDAETKVGAPK
ncbi:MAG: ABC transporter substrate-binding protein [Rhodospirillales bacterium]|nr:ABC transporter substrate-binding protein [Rhodospirillales bacterium]